MSRDLRSGVAGRSDCDLMYIAGIDNEAALDRFGYGLRLDGRDVQGHHPGASAGIYVDATARWSAAPPAR